MVSVVSGDDGRPVAVWAIPVEGFATRSSSTLGATAARVMARKWTGNGWGEFEEVFEAERLRFDADLAAPSTAVGEDGALFHYLRVFRDDAREERFVVERGPEGTWHRRGPLERSPGYPHQMVVGDEGRLMRVFSPRGLRFQTSDDRGASWSAPKPILGGAIPGSGDASPAVQLPTLFRAKDGTLHATASLRRIEDGNVTFEVWHSTSRDDGATWRPPAPMLTDLAVTRRIPVFLEDPLGSIHAFVTSGGLDASFVHLRWQGEGWSSPRETLPGVRSPVDAVVAGGSDGSLVAAYRTGPSGRPPTGTAMVEGHWICPASP